CGTRPHNGRWCGLFLLSWGRTSACAGFGGEPVFDPLPFAGCRVNQCQPVASLIVSDLVASLQVLGVSRFGDVVRYDRCLCVRARFVDQRQHMLFVRRQLQRSHGLARLQYVWLTWVFALSPGLCLFPECGTVANDFE